MPIVDIHVRHFQHNKPQFDDRIGSKALFDSNIVFLIIGGYGIWNVRIGNTQRIAIIKIVGNIPGVGRKSGNRDISDSIDLNQFLLHNIFGHEVEFFVGQATGYGSYNFV